MAIREFREFRELREFREFREHRDMLAQVPLEALFSVLYYLCSLLFALCSLLCTLFSVLQSIKRHIDQILIYKSICVNINICESLRASVSTHTSRYRRVSLCVSLKIHIYIYIYVYLSMYQCVVGVVVLHSALSPNVISEIMVFRYFQECAQKTIRASLSLNSLISLYSLLHSKRRTSVALFRATVLFAVLSLVTLSQGVGV